VSQQEQQPDGEPGADPATGAEGSAAGGAGEAGDPSSGRTPPPGEPSEAELQAAYEAELSRISSAEVMLQSTVSLLNIGRLRLGGRGPQAAEGGSGAASGVDLEQVRDAIDGARALLGVLDRRFDKELAPLRDALSQLQFAYAREAGAAAGAPGTAADGGEQQGPDEGGSAGEGEEKPKPPGPGPAEASGRLWVPGR
jgi:hypothetical protein